VALCGRCPVERLELGWSRCANFSDGAQALSRAHVLTRARVNDDAARSCVEDIISIFPMAGNYFASHRSRKDAIRLARQTLQLAFEGAWANDWGKE
jgi:hypothetical protein